MNMTQLKEYVTVFKEQDVTITIKAIKRKLMSKKSYIAE